ncbi:hypothetical protein CCACVL1_06832 [Corchorus capsularis]|uniref:Aminotransferase-like plant mobile domain-containing protein n=1 Tax=Corchorus capsularis TaxID=210143 RepID=A0A1R3JCF3_COCAP|nr:hypothetical protein CCACVL1_06832 [Corchorus capsularis]
MAEQVDPSWVGSLYDAWLELDDGILDFDKYHALGETHTAFGDLLMGAFGCDADFRDLLVKTRVFYAVCFAKRGRFYADSEALAFLLRRWNKSTHTFFTAFGEFTITLEVVATASLLPVVGELDPFSIHLEAKETDIATSFLATYSSLPAAHAHPFHALHACLQVHDKSLAHHSLHDKLSAHQLPIAIKDITKRHVCPWDGEGVFSFGGYPRIIGWLCKKVLLDYSSHFMPTVGSETKKIIVIGTALSLTGSFGVTGYHPNRVARQFSYDQGVLLAPPALPSWARCIINFLIQPLRKHCSHFEVKLMVAGHTFIPMMTPAMIEYWGRFISDFGAFMKFDPEPIPKAFSYNSRLTLGDHYKSFALCYRHSSCYYELTATGWVQYGKSSLVPPLVARVGLVEYVHAESTTSSEGEVSDEQSDSGDDFFAETSASKNKNVKPVASKKRGAKSILPPPPPHKLNTSSSQRFLTQQVLLAQSESTRVLQSLARPLSDVVTNLGDVSAGSHSIILPSVLSSSTFGTTSSVVSNASPNVVILLQMLKRLAMVSAYPWREMVSLQGEPIIGNIPLTSATPSDASLPPTIEHNTMVIEGLSTQVSATGKDVAVDTMASMMGKNVVAEVDAVVDMDAVADTREWSSFRDSLNVSEDEMVLLGMRRSSEHISREGLSITQDYASWSNKPDFAFIITFMH